MVTYRKVWSISSAMKKSEDIKRLADSLRSGDRAALGRAITLVESRRSDHRQKAQLLLQEVLASTGKAHRIGMTGVPGAGKSTTIDSFGELLIGKGHRVAVLAVDPTSQRTGGSILGDKTRMAKLSVNRSAFIRPSPAGETLGGVARRTRETMLLCEAAGYDIIIVETVGIGQSETAVAEMVDFFLCLMVPGTGDELQGIKKGVLEIADMIAVNKADGDNEAKARHAAADYRAALNIITPANANWRPPVLCISGLTGAGLEELWETIRKHRQEADSNGEFGARRQSQQVRWMWSMLHEKLLEEFRTNEQVASQLNGVEARVRNGDMTPALAVDQLLAAAGTGKVQ